MRLNLVCMMFGLSFGALFASAGFNQYDVIHQMLLLQNLEPFLVMGSAMLVALPLLWMLERRKWRTPLGGPLTLRRASFERKHLYGGAVFGVGWAITGACPGTLSTTIGSGSLMGIPMIAGIVLGIAVRDLMTSRRLAPTEPVPDMNTPPMSARGQ